MLVLELLGQEIIGGTLQAKIGEIKSKIDFVRTQLNAIDDEICKMNDRLHDYNDRSHGAAEVNQRAFAFYHLDRKRSDLEKQLESLMQEYTVAQFKSVFSRKRFAM